MRAINAYIHRLYRVAPQDPVVSLAFQRVVHLLDEPKALSAPKVFFRALRPGAANKSRRVAGAASLTTRPITGVIER